MISRKIWWAELWNGKNWFSPTTYHWWGWRLSSILRWLMIVNDIPWHWHWSASLWIIQDDISISTKKSRQKYFFFSRNEMHWCNGRLGTSATKMVNWFCLNLASFLIAFIFDGLRSVSKNFLTPSCLQIFSKHVLIGGKPCLCRSKSLDPQFPRSRSAVFVNLRGSAATLTVF